VDIVEEIQKKMKRLTAIGALGLLAASGLFAQGMNTAGQTKESWEEINFEFNSSILSDGYPSLLRLAELMGQHRDYRVKVTGHTDYVGSATYNDKLALRRAQSVKDFLVKYGANPDQVTTAGDGKRAPEVDNRSKEGRFMNRRVVLAVTNGQGQVIKEGGINDVLNALQDFMKKQEECCAQILKRLDKLDDILAALKNLSGENDKLRADLNELRNQHNMLRDQVAGLPKPLTQEQTQNIAHTEAMGAVNEAQRRNRKFSVVGANIGPTFGGGRHLGPEFGGNRANGGDTGGFTFTGMGRFFSPFGGDGMRAVQAQGEFMYYPGRKEGQFDIGLVNRWGNFQAGAFGSFKYLNFSQYGGGGGLAQAALLGDYIFSRGRIGVFVTRGFKNIAVLNSQALTPGLFLETYARVVNQQGINFLTGVWGDAYIEGDLAYLKMRLNQRDARPGGNLRLVQPITEHVAFTAEASYNETLTTSAGSGRVVVGMQVGNFVHPGDYRNVTHPVPMDVPRIRYEIGTRRVGASKPKADAGPDQLGIPAGLVTLNGQGSYDPAGEFLTYQWTQIAGPAVTLSAPTAAVTTFTATDGQRYSFRLTVRNTDNQTDTATTNVSTTAPGQIRIVSFNAIPAQIQSGQQSTLTWTIENATSASISPAVGNVDARSGSVSVSPTQTTTYTLTATGPTGTLTAQQIVQVTAQPQGAPQIVRFEANPVTIQPGQNSTLSWSTNNADRVTITPGPGNVQPNGSVVVTPSQTTTYTLSATNSSTGQTVTAPVTVVVAPGNIPQIVVFTANPPVIDLGTSTKLCWQVNNATNISISPGVGSNLNANDCATVSPQSTTTYTLTATNATGQIQANVTVTVGQLRILAFTADPVFSVQAGNPVTLAWQTQNATSVVIVGNELGPQTLPPNGTLVVRPITNTTYTLTAYGPGGQTISVTIEVFVR
jgi:hypothetical protein